MDFELFFSSLGAFHTNALNGLAYGLSSNWCMIVLVVATVCSIILGVMNETSAVVHDEQNVL